ncbi:MAG TPA: hypothetical protein PKD59_10975 [Miltoncostaeaceae bacterium]|nr:hypothetical protein [Miltoncostaeaceae bacterium]
MPDDPTTPAARIAVRARRLRTAGIAATLAMLTAFSGLAAGRVAAGHEDAAPPAASSPSDDESPSLGDVVRDVLPEELSGILPDGVVGPAAPSDTPDATSGAS